MISCHPHKISNSCFDLVSHVLEDDEECGDIEIATKVNKYFTFPHFFIVSLGTLLTMKKFDRLLCKLWNTPPRGGVL